AMLSLECLGYYSSTAGSQRYPSRLLGWLLPDTANFVGFAGDLRSRSLVRQSIRGFRQSVRFPSEGMVAPAIVPGIGWSDHWSFWQAGYPGIVVSGTALFRNANYHEATDTADTLDVEAMARVTTGLVGVVRHLDATLSR
ncbi:MAG: M28 family peptidase, partial [Acidobacteriota bacterium]